MARGTQVRPHVELRSRVRDPDKFAKALRAAGFTYRSLGAQLNCPHQTLNDYGRGKLRVLPAFAADIEKALSVDPGSLFTSSVAATPNKPTADANTSQQNGHGQS